MFTMSDTQQEMQNSETFTLLCKQVFYIIICFLSIHLGKMGWSVNGNALTAASAFCLFFLQN